MGPGHWLAMTAAWAAVSVVLVWYGRRPRLVVALLIVAWGGWWCAYRYEALADGLDMFIENGPVLMRGVVDSHPEFSEDRAFFVMRLRDAAQGDAAVDTGARVRVTVIGRPALAYGDIVQVRAELRRPGPATNPGAFDYRSYLERQGITATAFVAYPRYISVIGTARANPFMHVAGMFRTAVQRGLAGALPADAAAVASAVVLGGRRQLPTEIEEAFRRAGISHLLAVSGLHVGFFAVVGYSLLRALRGPPLVSAVVAIGLSWTYVLATGGRPPAVRAGVAATFGLAAWGLGRRREMSNALSAGALCLLVHNPLALFDVSFQMSFVATAAIMVAFSPLVERLAWLPRFIASGVAVTAAAQIGVLPLLAVTFQQISVVGFVGSVIGSPIVSLLVPVGIATGVLYNVSTTAGTAAGAVVTFLVVMLCTFAEQLAAWPWALIDVPRPPLGVMIAWWTLAWAALRDGLPARHRRIGVAAAVLLVIIALWSPLLGAVYPMELLIVMLDVGQGDAIFIRSPEGVTALVDGGGNVFSAEDVDANPGYNVLLPYFRYANIGSVDVVVNTHPHEDHLQGLLPVMAHRRVQLAVDGGQSAVGPSWHDYTELIDERDIVRWIPSPGDVIRLGNDTIIQVLHPSGLMTGTRSDLNNNSVVLRVVYGDTAALLTGDIEAEAQLALLKSGMDLRADVLKVPHHGSRWALVSAFYEAVGADIAVITVGRNNYGHPSEEVIHALESAGAEVYRTDVHGAVQLASDGHRWKVRTAVPAAK